MRVEEEIMAANPGILLTLSISNGILIRMEESATTAINQATSKPIAPKSKTKSHSIQVNHYHTEPICYKKQS